MSSKSGIARKTRNTWLLDLSLFLGGILATLSGIYFLFIPSGGYQGGRNPMYGITILLSRYTWEDVHLWGGIAMIVAAVVHFSLHWRWFGTMIRRVRSNFRPGGARMPASVAFNLAINMVIGVSFLLCAISGVYFVFAPAGGFQGGQNLAWDPGFLFARTTWDLIHTWSGVAMIVAAVLHFSIHWRWVKNVTGKFFKSLWPAPANQELVVSR
jgi:hypothetical protein